jgi:hypothetical protein
MSIFDFPSGTEAEARSLADEGSKASPNGKRRAMTGRPVHDSVDSERGTLGVAGDVNGVKTDEGEYPKLPLSLGSHRDDPSPFNAKLLLWSISGENDGGGVCWRVGEKLRKRGEQGDPLDANGNIAEFCGLRESVVGQCPVDGKEPLDSTAESLRSMPTWLYVEEERAVRGVIGADDSRILNVEDADETATDCSCLWLVLYPSALLLLSFSWPVPPLRRSETPVGGKLKGNATFDDSKFVRSVAGAPNRPACM